MSTLGLDGRIVIVTGAGNGLGRAHAHLLGSCGATVVVNDLGGSTDGIGTSTRAADHVVEEIRAAGGRATPSYDSVGEPAGCATLIADTIDAHGRIDAIVHNAGILRNAPIADMSDERIEPVLDVHLRGAIWLTREAWPHMVQQRYGRLVYTASGTGAWGRPDGANYASAKGGVIGLCNVAAIEGEEHGILANGVLPVAATRLAGMPDATDASAEAEARRREAADHNPRMEPDWISPLVAWLASPTCDRTHRFYSAAFGRFAEVFVGVTGGWVAPGDAPPTPEALVAALSTIEDRSTFEVPSSVFDEIARIRPRLPGEARVMAGPGLSRRWGPGSRRTAR